MNRFYFVIVMLLILVVFAENISIAEIMQQGWLEPTAKVITSLALIGSLITCLIMCRTKKNEKNYFRSSRQ